MCKLSKEIISTPVEISFCFERSRCFKILVNGKDMSRRMMKRKTLARFRRIRVFWEEERRLPRLHQSHLACASGRFHRLFLSPGVRQVNFGTSGERSREKARREGSSLLGLSHRVRRCVRKGDTVRFFPSRSLLEISYDGIEEKIAEFDVYRLDTRSRGDSAAIFSTRYARTRRTSGHLSLARFARLSHLFSSSFRAFSSNLYAYDARGGSLSEDSQPRSEVEGNQPPAGTFYPREEPRAHCHAIIAPRLRGRTKSFYEIGTSTNFEGRTHSLFATHFPSIIIIIIGAGPRRPGGYRSTLSPRDPIARSRRELHRWDGYSCRDRGLATRRFLASRDPGCVNTRARARAQETTAERRGGEEELYIRRSRLGKSNGQR